MRKTTRRTKDKQRDIKVYSNPIIKDNWDHSLTLQQNYKRLGLRAKLGSMPGGMEKELVKVSDRHKDDDRDTKEDRVDLKQIEQTEDPAEIPEGEARIIRDPETNEVVKVIYGTMKPQREEQPQESSFVIKQLEEQAIRNAQKVKDRKQSDRETDWIKDLYEKYGDDYEKMKWDKKLNVQQQSAGDLKRRINKWKKANGI